MMHTEQQQQRQGILTTLRTLHELETEPRMQLMLGSMLAAVLWSSLTMEEMSHAC